jgi:rSAM/selenodomain-associated transferase 2
VRLAIVMPVLDEAELIGPALARLESLRQRGSYVIVVDGGSRDDTARHAAVGADCVLQAARGRARQMNAGAAVAPVECSAFLFLHADTELPPEADRLVEAALQKSAWGRFDIEIAGRSKWLGLVARLMNLRSRLTCICTGDQAIFARRTFFTELGGFADIALMEDIDFCRRAKPRQRPVAISATARTSGRRWDKHGALRTILLMWELRLRFFLGGDPELLARRYREARS